VSFRPLPFCLRGRYIRCLSASRSGEFEASLDFVRNRKSLRLAKNPMAIPLSTSQKTIAIPTAFCGTQILIIVLISVPVLTRIFLRNVRVLWACMIIINSLFFNFVRLVSTIFIPAFYCLCSLKCSKK
jgi:hypothetical protein